ncbi:hypothetical protein CLV42_103404 [Chitinophaga ginsengisoli]|uniref:Uncharacterized protein n=1 Tax=Chitinophaga ginsengisoli TaxID=363837 RepID=A0A2P8GHI1_9BACT|nr:hypothetical protein CLV42_103404 [Chitinophaga ginsengisoli]
MKEGCSNEENDLSIRENIGTGWMHHGVYYVPGLSPYLRGYTPRYKQKGS